MKKLMISLLAATTLLPLTASADTAAELNAKVDEAIRVFRQEVDGGDVFLRQAAGYLVFPRVIKVVA